MTDDDNVLQKGDEGDDVAELQQNLKDLGFNPGPIDGMFGAGTEKAVMAFQNAYELYDDGVVGAYFMETMDDALNSDDFILSQRYLKRGLKGDDVARLQEILSEMDYDPGPVDGIFGGGTVKAVIQFQRDYDQDADGIVGPDTVEALLEAYSELDDDDDDDADYDDDDDA